MESYLLESFTEPLLGNAVLEGIFEDGSEEWLAHRATGLGGSDMGVIMGRDAHKSPYKLFHEKLGVIPRDEIDPKYAYWGHKHERSILERFAEDHPDVMVCEVPGTYRSTERDWQVINIDGLGLTHSSDEDEPFIIECKTSENGYGWGPEHTRDREDIPEKYLWQVMDYMDATGYGRAVILVLIGGCNYREYWVDYDPEMASALRERAGAFWLQLQTGQIPPLDGWESTVKLVRQFNPSIDKSIEVELPERIAEQWTEARRALAEAEAEKNRMDAHVLAHMGTAGKALYKGKPVAARQARGNGVPFLVAK